MMTTEHDFGKDHVVLMTDEDAEVLPKYQVPPTRPEDEPTGAILANGEINWDCPCLGGMASGPCALEFQNAFSCFHYSKEEVKGSECMEPFQAMQACLQKYPNLYPIGDGSDDKIDDFKSLEDSEAGAGGDDAVTSTDEQEQQKFAAAAAASQQKHQQNQ